VNFIYVYRIALIDYTPTGFAWLFGHGTAKEIIRKEMEAAGYRLIENFGYLSKQHFQVFHYEKKGRERQPGSWHRM
jgi:hypothetical protein